jgi:hypothetical protein
MRHTSIGGYHPLVTVELPVLSGDAGVNITLNLTYCYSQKVGWAAYLGNVGLSCFPSPRCS